MVDCRAPVQRSRCWCCGGLPLAVVGAIRATISGAAIAVASLMGGFGPGGDGVKEVVCACRDAVQFGAMRQVFRFPPVLWIIAGRGQVAAQILKFQNFAKALLGGDSRRS